MNCRPTRREVPSLVAVKASPKDVVVNQRVTGWRPRLLALCGSAVLLLSACGDSETPSDPATPAPNPPSASPVEPPPVPSDPEDPSEPPEEPASPQEPEPSPPADEELPRSEERRVGTERRSRARGPHVEDAT